MFTEWETNRVWYIDKTYRKFGFTHIQRMVIIKLDNEELMILSPIELTTQCQLALSQLGQVKFIISSTPTYHHHLSEWWLGYSKAYFFAPHALIEKRTDLNFDGVLSHQTPKQWQGQILQTSIENDESPNQMIFCDPASRTLFISNNLVALQSHLPLGQKFTTLVQGGRNQLTLPYRVRRKFTNKPKLRASIQEIMTWPFDRLISSNGLMIEKEAKDAFYQAFWWAFQ
ncbi:hypothetical protein [Vibrio aphrogenes]|uniref:hypothetical protein n=1 Tax=Vibrio aphrogenes TaxID=1891186 RepID=UPI000B3608D2|nr:hypothetical protein [Vibrio aphrogenes]